MSKSIEMHSSKNQAYMEQNPEAQAWQAAIRLEVKRREPVTMQQPIATKPHINREWHTKHDQQEVTSSTEREIPGVFSRN